jgi:hypothetical protein
MPKTVTTAPQQPDDWLKGRGIVLVAKAVREIGISIVTARKWIDAGILPRPVQPMKGKSRGRRYFRVTELQRALDQLPKA